MSTSSSRTFLQTVGATAAAVLARPDVSGDSPFKPQDGPHMKLSLAAYSYRDICRITGAPTRQER